MINPSDEDSMYRVESSKQTITIRRTMYIICKNYNLIYIYIHFQFYIVYCTSPRSTVITHNRTSILAMVSHGIPSCYFKIRPLHHNVPNLGICIYILERLWHFMVTEYVTFYGYTLWQVCEPYFSLLCFCRSSLHLFRKGISWAECNWLV